VGLVRSSNQDSGYASPNLLVVADGMGGHAGGDVASTIAIEILKHLDHPGHTPATALRDLETALDHSQLAMIRASDTAPQLQGLGTTVVCLMRTDTTLVMAHMGDSRAYLLRNGQLTQVTVDHTFVQHLVDIGRITPAEAETHPQRNVVMRVLSDFDLDLHPDVSIREAKIGDRWLLCSDGLSGFVSPAELTHIMANVKNPGEAADLLIDKALQNQSTDNVTCLIADIVDPDAHFAPKPAIANADPMATVDLGRPIPKTQVVGAAATGGPLPDLVDAVVAGDDWDDLHDDAEPMSDYDLAEHGLVSRERIEELPTNPIPVVTPASGTPLAVLAANTGARYDPLVPHVLDPNVAVSGIEAATSVVGADNRTEHIPQPPRVDPLYLHDDDPRALTAPRRRPWLTITAIVASLAVLVAALFGGYTWTQRQYFVGLTEINQVAIFRGIPQDLGPLNLHRKVLVFDTDATTFGPLYLNRLTETIPANSFDDAVERASQLIIEARSQLPRPPAPLPRPAIPPGQVGG